MLRISSQEELYEDNEDNDLRNEINSIFNVKIIESSVYYIFFGSEHVSFKS